MECPLYIASKEDFSIRIYKSPKDLIWFEEADVEAEIYSGWDAKGYPFRVVWTNEAEVQIEQTSDVPQPEELKNAIFAYVDMRATDHKPGKPFVYDKNSHEYEKIIDALEKHITNSPAQQSAMGALERF